MKKITLTLAVLAFMSFAAVSQDMNALSKAFDSSYTYEKAGYYTQAIAKIKNLYDPASYEINLRLGWLYYEAGSYTESTEYYQRAILLQPYAIEPRLGIIYPYSSMGNWNQVLDNYNKILEVDPMNTYANYKVGMIYYYREQYETALKYFEKVANLYPFDYDNTLMYAWTNYKLGKLREAKILFQKVLLNRPGDASALEGLGLIQ